MAEALLALGGNVGDTRATLARAIDALCDGTETRLLARSSDYLTPPWGVADQPPFVNACILVETALAPVALLRRAQAIERACGRDRAREQRWGPRPLDIDLLAYDDLVFDSPDLTLPHPRLWDRAFVLVPLAEIAAGRTIAGTVVGEALARVDTRGIVRLPPPQD
jgi:2-amino-4-hydroxy-6-hydroxymethyldihydropteridine diphosphokinase